jgi:hypothetical protein
VRRKGEGKEGARKRRAGKGRAQEQEGGGQERKEGARN